MVYHVSGIFFSYKTTIIRKRRNNGSRLKKLQNGSDIRGVALEGVKGEAVNLGIEEAAALTAGFVRWLCEKTGKAPETLKVSVGTDSRISRDILRKAVIQESMSLTAAWHLHRQCSCLRYFPNTPVTEQ